MELKMALVLVFLLITGIITTVMGAGTLVQYGEDKLQDGTPVKSSIDFSHLFGSTGVTTLASSIGLMLILLVFCLGLLVFCSVHRP